MVVTCFKNVKILEICWLEVQKIISTNIKIQKGKTTEASIRGKTSIKPERHHLRVPCPVCYPTQININLQSTLRGYFLSLLLENVKNLCTLF